MLALTYTAGDAGPRLAYTAGDAGPRLERDRPLPVPGPGEALVQVLRAGICATVRCFLMRRDSHRRRGRAPDLPHDPLKPKKLFLKQDLEIVRGYVPGYAGVLGHEFVGIVTSCPSAPAWEGVRVVGEINCVSSDGESPSHPPPPSPLPIPATPADAAATLTPAPDPASALARNHAPNRTVLGIIGRDGCAAEFVALPLANLHALPEDDDEEGRCLLPDARAVFAEPLAAACRVVEQGLVRPGDAVAVVGDGRLGLLLAGVISVAAGGGGGGGEGEGGGGGGGTRPSPPLAGTALTHFGRHASKLALVPGAHATVLVPRDDADAVLAPHAGGFDVVIEASRGGPAGAVAAARLLKPGGRLVLKSTCAPPQADGEAASASTGDSVAAAASWAAFSTDVVVNEKAVAGSRCGPFPPALALLTGHPAIGALVDAMVSAEFDLADGVAAFEEAGRPGVVKVQLVTAAGRRREAERRKGR
jgi:threonine dehydrogenase-like Zn-dependent dehydrogenase